MHPFPRFVLALLLLFLSGYAGYAQEYPVVKYTVREGLVQNQVLTLFKDSRGFVWCGTWYGLSKFNGETFENYTEAEGLWNGVVNHIIEDNKGYIWILGRDKLACFDGKTFKKYDVPFENTDRLLFNANTNEIQILGRDARLWTVQRDTLVPVVLPGFPRGFVNTACYHALSDTYLIQFEQKMVSYRKGLTKTILDEPGWGVDPIIHGNIHLGKLFPNGDRQLAVIRKGAPVTFLELNSTTFSIRTTLAYPFIFVHKNGLYYLPAHSMQARRISEAPPAFSRFEFLDQAESSVVWIPTEKGLWGLMLTGFQNFQESEVTNTWSVVEDSQGEFLFLNHQKGVQRYDGIKLSGIPRSRYYPIEVQALRKQGVASIPDTWYFRALRDQKGHCWLPVGSGLFRYANSHWEFTRPKHLGAFPFSVAEDVARQKIVCASYRHFFTVDINPPFRTDSIRGTSTLFNRLLLCTVVASTGEYWFSGYGGVEKYDPDTRKFSAYTLANGKFPTDGRIPMLYIDWNGTLWAGGSEELYRYNPARDLFEKMFDFRFDQNIQFVEQISPTHLMIADMRNLYVLDLKKFNDSGQVEMKCFNHHNGFMGLEPGQLGSYRDSRGRIWITSASVLSVLDPTQLDLSTRPLRTYITQVNQQGVSFIHPEQVVEVPQGQNMVTVRAEALGEDRPFRSQFSYRLEGEMDQWTDWQEQPLITLDNLSNGTHTLLVRARSGNFKSHEASIATLHFTTSVHFWKSPNFYLYASLVGLGLLMSLMLLWQRDLRKSRTVLEQREQLEKRERSMRLLQAQTIQSQMNPHFTSNALASIQRQILTHDAERASDNLVKMGRLTRAYLEDSLLREDDPLLMNHDISLTREVTLLRMYVELMQLQYEDRFDFVLDIQSSLNTDEYRLPPFLIQPFVENAIVHGLHHLTSRGMLRVQFLGLPNEALLCQIEDNGIGREGSRRLLNQAPKEYTSVSTNLSQKRAELLNQMGYSIEIKIEDRRQGAGTVVTIQIGYS